MLIDAIIAFIRMIMDNVYTWAFIHKVDGRQEVSKPRDSGLDVSNHFYLTGTSVAAPPRCPVTFQSDTNIITSKLVASRLREIWW